MTSLTPDHLSDPAAPPAGAPKGAVHGAATIEPTAATQKAKPDGLPDKFWDGATGTVRLDQLIQSYRALERRLSETPQQQAQQQPPQQMPAAQGVPDSPDAYRIDTDDPLVQPDAEVNAILHAEGFSERQVQLVYDLASEVLSPIARQLAMQAAGAGHKAKLEAHFGGPERWAEVRRQLRRWAEGKLPDDAYKALVSSYEGVLSLHRMMERKEEPDPLTGGDPVPDVSEEQLRRKMRDPRYWRERDPKILREVTNGYKQLYPNG
jgi:hypothetical protein